MRIIVGSEKEPKLRSVEKAFSSVFDQEEVSVEPSLPESGVSDHPTTAEESLEGAINRAEHAREVSPGADYYVGIEGGFLRTKDRTLELGWVAVINAEGEVRTACSAGVEIGGKILDSILGGQELNDVLEERFGIKGAGNANGYYGIVTDNQITREQAYTDAVKFALAPFHHPEFYE